jgi:hypothetical protein
MGASNSSHRRYNPDEEMNNNGPLPKTSDKIECPANLIESTVYIHRDDVGVPHIYANSSSDLFVAGFIFLIIIDQQTKQSKTKKKTKQNKTKQKEST